MSRGELICGDVVHWEALEFQSMFMRGITPSDFDRWTGFTDLAGDAAGPLVIFEFEREWKRHLNGQARALRQLRLHLQPQDWFIVVRHTAETSHVWPGDITTWLAYRCASRDAEPAFTDVGVDTLSDFVRQLDPFGAPISTRSRP